MTLQLQRKLVSRSAVILPCAGRYPAGRGSLDKPRKLLLIRRADELRALLIITNQLKIETTSNARIVQKPSLVRCFRQSSGHGWTCQRKQRCDYMHIVLQIMRERFGEPRLQTVNFR
jgi:hypothetical protein